MNIRKLSLVCLALTALILGACSKEEAADTAMPAETTEPAIPEAPEGMEYNGDGSEEMGSDEGMMEPEGGSEPLPEDAEPVE